MLNEKVIIDYNPVWNENATDTKILHSEETDSDSKNSSSNLHIISWPTEEERREIMLVNFSWFLSSTRQE
jgi:hypothetical protein